MKAFKNFCLPQFLMKGDIYEKIFHEKLTLVKKQQVATIAKNLWTIHQTFSTKGIAKLQDIDIEGLRARPMAQESGKKGKKSLVISSDINMEELKTLNLKDEEKGNKNVGSFQTFGKHDTMSPESLRRILHKKSMLSKRSAEKESFIVNKKQKMNGTLMNFLIDASNRASITTTTAQDRLKEFQVIKKSMK
jgi:hypothetical protein